MNPQARRSAGEQQDRREDEESASATDGWTTLPHTAGPEVQQKAPGSGLWLESFTRSPSAGGSSPQLSAFLTRAMSAANSCSLQDVLRAVVQETAELLGANCCLATVALERHPRAIEAVSSPDSGTRWTEFVRWLDLFGIYELVRLRGGTVRMNSEQLGRLPVFRIAAIDRPLRGWLAASLTTMDGSDLGAIQLFDKHNADFNADDEATIVYLAEFTSAVLQARLPRKTGVKEPTGRGRCSERWSSRRPR